MDFLGLTAAGKSVFELAKSAKDLLSKGDDTGAKESLAQLQGVASGMLVSLAAALEENCRLREAADRRAALDELRARFEWIGVYFLSRPYQSYHAAFYCPSCFNGDGIVMPIVHPHRGVTLICPRCKGAFSTALENLRAAVRSLRENEGNPI